MNKQINNFYSYIIKSNDPLSSSANFKINLDGKDYDTALDYALEPYFSKEKEKNKLKAATSDHFKDILKRTLKATREKFKNYKVLRNLLINTAPKALRSTHYSFFNIFNFFEELALTQVRKEILLKEYIFSYAKKLNLNTNIFDISGYNINEIDSNGKTLLRTVIETKNYEDYFSLEYLIACEANPYIPDNSGVSAIHYAISNQDFKSTELFLYGSSYEPPRGLVRYAIEKSSPQIVELLLDYGLNDELFDEDEQGISTIELAFKFCSSLNKKIILLWIRSKIRAYYEIMEN